MQGNIDLAQFDEDFAGPTSRTGSLSRFQTAHTRRMSKVELTRSKSSETPMLKWTLEILAQVQRKAPLP